MAHDAITIGDDGKPMTLMWCGRYMAKTLEAAVIPEIEKFMGPTWRGKFTRIDSVEAIDRGNHGWCHMIFRQYGEDGHTDAQYLCTDQCGAAKAFAEWSKHAVAKDQHDRKPWWHHAE